MKSYIYRLILISSIITFSITSCEDQVLDKDPLDSFSENDVWNDIELVKLYVWNNYNALRYWSFDENTSIDLPAAYADDVFLIFNYGSYPVNTGVISPDDMAVFTRKWTSAYNYIRNINIFFDRIDAVEVADESEKLRLKGEMKFIRAWLYDELIHLFGGVPIIVDVFHLEDNFQVQRNSYQECVDWIIKELDEAKNMVPEVIPSDEFGRVTKGAVLALKARVLLYAASKLYDPATIPNGPLYDYNKDNKWQEAAVAHEEVINMDYELVEINDAKEYQEMLLQNNSEIIFAKPFHPQFLPWGRNYDYVNSPNGYAGWSANCPTQNLVDAFEMEDGLSIEESPLYDSSANSIYDKREIRFYANIVYNGSHYRGREVEFFIPGGLDSPDGREGWNATKTGYTIRKQMNESINPGMVNPTTPKIYFRLAEIYLSYAEIQYHLGNEAIAREFVNKIRDRVHLPFINSSGEELLNDIRHERRIELCFEDHRFWDVRRWMIAEEILSENAKGIQWKKVNAQGELDYNGELTYTIINSQDRNFLTRMYHIPIPRAEIEKSSALEQNWGYQ